MKKNLLNVMMVLLSGVYFAQQPINTTKIAKAPKRVICDGNYVPLKTFPKQGNNFSKNPNNTVQAITNYTLGTAGNVFTLLGNRTYLWADPQLNTIAMSHRYEISSNVGYLTYDVSKNGGTVWSSNVTSVYTPSGAAATYGARYPQGVIYNPLTNISNNPDSAYFCYFAPTRDASNPDGSSGDWGGITFGVHQLSNNVLPTQNDWSSNNQNGTTTTANIFYEVPNGHTLTKTGVIHNLDAFRLGIDPVAAYNYQDTINHSVGIWNSTSKDFQFVTTKVPFPMSENDAGINIVADEKISFADDGLTGYISLIGHASFWSMPDSTYYLIVYKTTDGGVTWGTPISIDLGPTDQLLANGGYLMTTAFEHSSVVDSLNNLHMLVDIGISGMASTNPNGFSILSAPGNFGVFDVYTTDGGTTWKAKLLDKPQFFRGNYGANTSNDPDIAEDNRPFASRNWNGSKLFFSWFATDTVTNSFIYPNGENIYPDMFSAGFDVKTGKWAIARNMTANAAGIGTEVYFGTVSHYTLPAGNKEIIPCVYAKWQFQTGTGQPLDLMYIHDAGIDNTEFSTESDSTNLVDLNLLLTVDEVKGNTVFSVSQNYPNPFNGVTTIKMNMLKAATVTVTVTNMIGQTIKTETKSLNKGAASLQFNASELGKGIYYYTIKTDGQSTTKKMIVN